MGNKYLEKIAAKYNVDPPSNRGPERIKSISMDSKEMKRYEESKDKHFTNKAGKYTGIGAAAGAALGYALMRKPRRFIGGGTKVDKIFGATAGGLAGASMGAGTAEERAHNKAIAKVTGRK